MLSFKCLQLPPDLLRPFCPPSLPLSISSLRVQQGRVCLGKRARICKRLRSPHCYKTFRRIPPPSTDDAGLILLGRGKRLLYMGREFAPSGTEVFRNHRKFPAIFTMKKGSVRMLGSNSVSLDYYSCPLPLDHGYHVLNVKNIQ